MCSLDCDFVMSVGFVLGNRAYIVLCLNEHMTTYSVFVDGASHYTLNLASAGWVLYSLTNDLVSLEGTCLGPATNNLAKSHEVTGFLTKFLTSDVIQIMVYLDSDLLVH